MNKWKILRRRIFNTFNLRQIQRKESIPAEKNILQINRLYATLSQINQTILRVRDRETLFGDICDVAIRYGQFRMAWIGLVDDTKQFIRPAAYAGKEQKYLSKIHIYLNDEKMGHSPTGEALRKGHSIFYQDIAIDPRMLPWRDEALKRGFRASAAIPIRYNSEIIGAFMVYAAEPFIFDAKEMQLLEEIGSDISFALDMIEKENQRIMASVALKTSEKRYRELLENINLIAVLLDVHGKVTFCNPYLLTLTGYTYEELLGSDWFEQMIPDVYSEKKKVFIHGLKKEKINEHVENQIVTKDGELLDIVWNITILRNDSDSVIGTASIGEDVTERKRAAEALSESEERYRTMINNSNDLVQSIAPDGHFLFVNSIWIKTLGYSKEEISHLNMFDVIHPESLPHCRTLFEKIISGENVSHLEATFVTKDGRSILLEGNAAPRLLNEKVIATQSFFHDITERKKAEEDLKKAHHTLKNLHDNLEEAIFSLDTVHNTMLQASVAHEAVFGYSPAEFFKTPQLWYELVLPEDKPIVDKGYAILMSGNSHRHEVRIKRADGQIRWIEAKMKPTLDTKGKLIQVDGIVSDITERKRTEEALRDSEKKYRSIFENVQDVYYETVLDGTIVEVSPSIELISSGQYHREDLIGKSMYEFYYDRNDRDALIATMQKTGSVTDFEVRLKNRDGSVIWCSISAKMSMNTEGKIDKIIGSMHDISERQQTEEALRESEKKYRELIDGMNETVWVIDFEGNLVDVNNTTTKVLGYSKEELLTMGLYGVDSSLKRENIQALAKAMPLDKLQIFETAHTTKDGKTFPVEVYSSLVTYQGKQAILSIARDITERKQAEEKIRMSESSLIKAQEIAKLGNWTYDVNDNIIKWSEEMYRIYGVSPDSFILNTESFVELIHPEDRHAMHTWIEECTTGKNPNELEFRVVHSDGIIHFISGRGELVCDANGLTLHMSGTAQDITERKIAENKLIESEEKYRSIFENIQDVFYQIDKQGIITEMSPSIFRLAGYLREEIIGAPVASFYYDLKERDILLNLIGQQNEIRDFEISLKTKMGTVKYASLNAQIMFNEANEQVGIEGSLRDIDDRKQMETELMEAKEKAEESDRLKTAFLHNISHEIRTPMNAIVGFSGLLNNPGLLPEKRKHFTEIISYSSEQLLSIINDIVNIATIEAGQEKITQKEIDLNATLCILYQQFLLKAQKQNVRLSLKPSLPQKAVYIISDEIKLIQVLTNLIGNALKFTKQGDVNFGYVIKDIELEFLVEDTGIGIPPEMQQEIFRRFRQLESTNARQFGGSGLGLSISKAYVELLGGKIWVSSALGKGSKFYFTIPYNRTKKNTISKKQTKNNLKSEGTRVKTLLIAEDEDSNFDLLEELLSGLEINIIRAINGLEAIKICKSNQQIDLVLMDIKMPVMDGYEATQKIREFMPDLPIIAQTAYSEEIDKNKALACGCNDFISKPFKQEFINSKITGLLNKK